MDILDKHIVLRLNNVIINGFEKKDNPKEYRDYKQMINSNYGIFFYNIMKTTNNKVWTIMAKRKSCTYVYSFNSTTKELTLKGERRNACA